MDRFNQYPFNQFFGWDRSPDQQQEYRTRALGSGVIVDASKGYIITNNHVVNDMDKIMPYKKGAAQYVNSTLKKGENINLY